MKKEQKRLLGSAVAIVVLTAFVAYGHYAITEITSTFVEGRKSESKFFQKMVRDNWDGIKSISDDKKKTLLENLNPELAGADIEIMGFLCRILVYVIGAGLILDRLIAIARLLFAKR